MEHKIIIDVTIITPTIEEIVNSINASIGNIGYSKKEIKELLYSMVIVEKLNRYRDNKILSLIYFIRSRK